MAKKKKSPGKNVPQLKRIDETMREWSALLAAEVADWPGVTTKNMFGMASFYRADTIFAAVPVTRALFTPTSIIFKLDPPPARLKKSLASDLRVNLNFGIGQKWYGFELASPADLHGALEWMNEAFLAARRRK